MKSIWAGLFALLLGMAVLKAEEKPLDFWDEEIRSIATAPADKHVDYAVDAHRQPGYFYKKPPKEFHLDHADKQVGDLSVLYLPGKAPKAAKVGFLANLWGGRWTLTPDMALTLHLKTTGTNNPGQWGVTLVDEADKTAVGQLEGTNTGGEWRELTLPLASLKAGEGFDWTKVRLCEFEAKFGEDSQVRFDGVAFQGGGKFLGVTDKPVSQRMAEAEATREFRTLQAMRGGAAGGASKAVRAFCKMYLNEDLETANQWLSEDLTKMLKEDPWSLLSNPLYCRFYYWFSHRAGKFPGRLKPEVEKQLLETLWDRTVTENDIALTKQNTWWMQGSENHDLNNRVSSMVSSRIFMNEPDYKDRIYPDYGFGGAYNYGASSYIGEGIDPAERHGGGRANLKDGKEYKAADHYKAWLANLKEYFRERAQRGFLLEYWAGYTRHTLNFVDLASQYGGDEELKAVISDFLTFYWSDWAQKEISGVLGGPKTRLHGVGGYDSSTEVVLNYLGGAGNGGVWWYWNLLNDYRLPKVVWQMALDRQGMGEFAYLSRGIGEEENLWPRPPGTERTLLCDTDSRFLIYTYVTPDYTLGCQMDHPAAVHSHLSVTNRWQGMTFAQSPSARIVPLSYTDREKPSPDTGLLFVNAQHKDVLICQLARNFTKIDPTWFPGRSSQASGSPVVVVHVGTDWDQQIEKDGWIFLQKGNAYGAIRPVLWDEKYEAEKAKKTSGTQVYFNDAKDEPTVKLLADCYTWSEDRSRIELKAAYMPVVIQAGRKADYPTLEAFMGAVLANPIALYKTVVPGFNILTYTGNGKGAEQIVFNAGTTDMPTIGGKPIDYSYGMTADSPYLKSKYKSGKVAIQFGGEKLNLNFNKEKK